MTRTVALLAAWVLLASCSTTAEQVSEKVIDWTPAWMGGLPKDAPPRLGTPEYDELHRKQEAERARDKSHDPNPEHCKAAFSFALDNDAATFRAEDDSVPRHHLDRIEAFGENSQLALTATAHNTQRQRHRADQQFLTIGHRHAPLRGIQRWLASVANTGTVLVPFGPRPSPSRD